MTIFFDLGAFLLNLTSVLAACGLLTLVILLVVFLEDVIKNKKSPPSKKSQKERGRLRFYFDSNGHMKVKRSSPVDRAIEELK